MGKVDSAPLVTRNKRASFTTAEKIESKKSLLDRLGGSAALKEVVYSFYGRIVADEALAHFFEGVSMSRMRDHQQKFMEIAFTKIPEDLDVAKYIEDRHARLFQEKGLNETHFDLVAGHLIESLKEFHVDTQDIDSVVQVVGPLRAVFEANAIEVAEEKKQTLLERLGGPAALKAAVTEFYGRLLADDDLSPFFEGADMDMLRDHQYKFMELAFTQIPKDLDVVEYIAVRHQRLFNKGLNASHFDMVAGHLVGTLEHLNVKQEHIDEVVATVGPLRVAFEQNAI